MAKYDVSSQRASLLSDATTVACLPPELLQIIRSQNSTNLLDALSQAALIPRLTGRIFAHFEPVFADICARWLLNTQNGSCDDSIIAAFARILPFAPQLSVFLDGYLKNSTPAHDSQAHSTPQLNISKASQDLTVGGFAAGPAAPAAAAVEVEEEAAPAAQEKTLFSVKLMSFEAGAKPKVIKEIKALLGLSLVDSKKFVESAPKMMKESVPKEEAEGIVAKLKELGAVVQLD